ncbi:hypothetical protein [Mucilaginibacter gotjawali]|uniref:Uncharacterized protein n=2 Tax=Mucilaginibacter gotjawali TaxID=1550579 RepID=A0A839SI90_9SPHI|nr:hypothetical protein [Mucilaginibacter gotjawali]MBB3057566.1 hypothetical protein [Mucilaginibacter gotjawali]BAU55224.1 hypothetical protein MgSA37_03405 [Mucilaginibacter gotjawali]
MKPFNTLFITFSLIISFCCAFGQNKFAKISYKDDSPFTGYIINEKGDTVKCEFKKPALGPLRYKPVNSTDKFKKPSPDAVKEYFSTYDSCTYVALYADTNSSDMTYLKRLENGLLCLYEQVVIVNRDIYMNGYYYGSSNNIYVYVNKDNGTLREIKSNTLNIAGESRKKRKAYLLSLIADDADLAKQFDAEQDYDIKTLRHYIHAYNVFKSAAAK